MMKLDCSHEGSWMRMQTADAGMQGAGLVWRRLR